MRIAVAGGIASGKSHVGRILREAGAIVLDADKINAKLSEDKNYIGAVGAVLGDIYVKDGHLNKTLLRKQIVSDDNFRQKLNALAHPLIRNIIIERCNEIEKERNSVFVEIPLLITADMRNDFDIVWYVKCSFEERVERIVRRDGIERSEAVKLINSQEKELSAENIASLVIDTTDSGCVKALVVEEYDKLNNRLAAHLT